MSFSAVPVSVACWWVLAPGVGAPPWCLSHPELSAGHGVAVETGGVRGAGAYCIAVGQPGGPEGAAGPWCWWPHEGLEVPCGETFQLMKIWRAPCMLGRAPELMCENG